MRVGSLVSLSVLGLVGCSNGPTPQGQIAVCYAIDALGEDDDGPFVTDLTTELHTRTGLRAADPDTSRPAPDSFTSCISTIAAPVQVELIDGAGKHLWLAVDVVARGEQLITPSVFADIEDGELTIGGNRAWGISDVLTLTSGGDLRLALQNGLPLDDAGADGLVTIEDAGSDGLPTYTTCQSITARALSFRGSDNSDLVLKNGEVGEVDSDGDYLVANIGSWEFGEANCTDIPSGATHVSWAVIKR